MVFKNPVGIIELKNLIMKFKKNLTGWAQSWITEYRRINKLERPSLETVMTVRVLSFRLCSKILRNVGAS